MPEQLQATASAVDGLLEEHRRLRLELDVARRQLAEAQALARLGSWEWDIPANSVTWSDELYRIYGFEPRAFEPTYEEFLARVHPDDRDAVDARNRKAFADHMPFEDVKQIVRPDGSLFLMRTQGEVIVDEHGAPLRMIGICEDVTAEVREREARALLASIVESSNDAIWARTPDGTIVTWNPAAERLFGRAAAGVIGRSDAVLLPPGRTESFERLATRAMAGERISDSEAHFLNAHGDIVEIALTLSAIRDVAGNVSGVSVIARDIAERRGFEQRLQHLAAHDALTDLFNRRRFDEELAIRVADASRGVAAALLLIDVDSFAYVNEMHGRRSGDDLLRGIAAAIRSALLPSDFVARLGSDEFAVLVSAAGREGAAKIAADLLDAIRRHEGTGGRAGVTASIGLAVTGAVPSSAEELFGAAERALRQAKDEGRDRFVALAPERSPHGAPGGWEHRIRAALEQRSMLLHCQPIVDVATGEERKYELLLRMPGPDGPVLPGEFLPTAERRGLVQAIDRWVVAEGIALLGRHEGIEIAVNLSGQSMGDHALPDLIERELRAHGVDPARLILEITETAAIANMERARRFAHALAGLGCRFALDDFGVGFGSFHYLKYLPADYLKIDGDFIRSPRSATDDLVIEAIVNVARGMGKKTVAEWVGDDETLSMLAAHGVDYAQGFHIGRPFPVGELGARLAR